MSAERITKSLIESDTPVYVDPKTVTKGYLVIPMRFLNAIGRAEIGTFIGDTLYSAWPDIYGEVRKCQPNFQNEGFCIPDHVEPDPIMGVNELDKLIDKKRYTIVIQTFQIQLPGERAVTVYGGFCFPENPARLLLPSKGKLLSISVMPKETKVKEKVTTSEKKSENKWWQFWK